MPPPPTSTGTQSSSKLKTTLVLLCMAMAMLFLLRTGYMRIIKHSSTKFLIAASNFIILFLFFHYRRNPDQIPHPPLFSFPSLSQQPRYNSHLAVNNVDLPEPVISHLPPVVSQHLETDTVYDRGSTTSDGVVLEREEQSERISIECGEHEISNSADDRVNDDQESDGNMDETWNSIVARGKATPVRLFTSNQRESNLKPEMKKPKSRKRKEKKKITESSSYDSGERKAEGWRKEGATGISGDELSHLSEMFIRNHHNNLRIERQESDQRRGMARLSYRNLVSSI